MPHLILKNVQDFQIPAKSGEVEFLFRAENLIAVKTQKAKFFIKIIKRDSDYLLKYDKITRPLISEIKKAYTEFVNLSNARVLFENISGIKEKIPHKGLLEITDDLSGINIVEVGFGSGRHLLHLAKKHPQKTLLGIEIHKPSIEQVLKRATAEKTDNIKIINHDARIILSKIASNTLDAVYVHFPVPWDKKPHRRVINTQFIIECVRTLKKGGFLHLRTDSENYFNYSLLEFLKFQKIDLHIKKNMPYEISSKYEERWLKMNKNIYDIYMYSHEISKPLVENFDFSFEKKLKNLTFKPIIFENFVIHIEKVYKINENEELIRATMGNFNRPEHIYIVNSDKPYYFKPPAAVRENYLAHKELKRLFNGNSCRS